jgi:hypothetical protein
MVNSENGGGELELERTKIGRESKSLFQVSMLARSSSSERE